KREVTRPHDAHGRLEESMQLVEVTVEGYRTFKSEVSLHIDSRITVLLGANDHGKSNLLAAISHSNDDKAFTSDDLNWDLASKRSDFPKISWLYDLTLADRQELSKLDLAKRTADAE